MKKQENRHSAVFLFLDACQVDPYAQEGTRTSAAHIRLCKQAAGHGVP